jgi:rhamnosyltransferase subunit B
MKFAVVTLGSAGDLHPFLAVARALVERGHEVHLLTQAPYEAAVRAEGVGFMPIASLAEHERTLRHPLLWHPLHGFGVLWRHLAVPAIGPTIEALDALSRDSGSKLTVFASPLAAGARLARECWPERIRLLSGYTAPMGLRSTADPMFLGAWRVPGWLPDVARRGLWRALDRWKLEPMARPALARWTERLGLAPFASSFFGEALHSPDGGIAMYPDWFAPVPAPWRERGVRQTGFPVFEAAGDILLPPAVSTFIDDHRPYVVVYPGSADQRAGAFAQRVISACQALDQRVLVLSRFRDPTVVAGQREVLWVDEAPLGRVNPRASAFVHHGGIGSVAQGMAARVPQLILASAYDQFENGARLERLRQGHWQPVTRASTSAVQNQLAQWRGFTRSSALIDTPCPSGPRAPNVAVEETCEMLEGTPNQSSLFDDSPAAAFALDHVAPGRGKLQGYKLFTALVPPLETAERLADVGKALARQLGLRGRPLEAERLHITMHDIAYFAPNEPVPRNLVDAAIAAGNSVVHPAFPICFDSVMSFPESDAFVLRCDSAGDVAIARLRQLLSAAFKHVSLPKRAIPTPHMTLLYDRRHLPQSEIDPLRWTAGRFVLILSHRGLHHHQRIREWPMAGSA